MDRYPLRPSVPMDDDARSAKLPDIRPVSVVSFVSYAIHTDADHWFADMIMSPGHWPSTIEKEDG